MNTIRERIVDTENSAKKLREEWKRDGFKVTTKHFQMESNDQITRWYVKGEKKKLRK